MNDVEMCMIVSGRMNVCLCVCVCCMSSSVASVLRAQAVRCNSHGNKS